MAAIGPLSLCAVTETGPFGMKPCPGTVQLTVDCPRAYPARPSPNDSFLPVASRRLSAERRSRRSPLLRAVSVSLSPFVATDHATVAFVLFGAPKKTGME